MPASLKTCLQKAGNSQAKAALKRQVLPILPTKKAKPVHSASTENSLYSFQKLADHLLGILLMLITVQGNKMEQ